MTGLVASAPGKLFLCGEYAVLEGALGLVASIPRRAWVELEPRALGPSTLWAPALGRGEALGQRATSQVP